VTFHVASEVQNALQYSLFGQRNDAHSSSQVNSIFQSWQNF